MADKRNVEVVVGLRLPKDLLRQADALVPRLERSDLRAAGRVSRSTVLRLAVIRGLEVVEREYK